MKTQIAGPFRALRSFNFRVWSVGALVSNIGTWMQRVAQDWLVLTQLTHHDASAVGVVMGLQFAPQLLLLPWTGFAADHFNQRKLLMVTQAAMGVLALALGALTVLGAIQLWQVYVFAFVFGSVAALDAPVRQTFVAELVSDEDLPSAISLNSTSFNAARMVGPAAAGLVIARAGTGWAFLMNGISFGGIDLDGIVSPRRDARQRKSIAFRKRVHGRAAVRMVPARSSSNPDHAVSDRDIRVELPDLHFDHGRQRLPHRRARFRPAVVDHGCRYDLRSTACQRHSPAIRFPSVGSRRFWSGMHFGRNRARLLVVRRRTGHRRHCGTHAHQ
jgi:Transmembrane secretion effector